MSEESKLRAFASRASRAGSSGYWELPEIRVEWAFEAGLPDPATFPVDDLVRLSERVLRSDAKDGLQYGGGAHGSIVYGYEGLRDLLAERTAATDGRQVGRREIMLTSGGVQALTLACQAFLDPGDVFAVEAPTWGAVLTAGRRTGAEPIAIPLDLDGLRVDLLERELERLASSGKRLKLVYTIATFHTPTGVCLSLERRRRLIELAEKWDFLVIEDNVYGELRYEGETIPTLFALDDSDRVVKVDSFSKILAPALRLGWVTGHADAIATLSAVRGDLGVSQWLGRVMAEYLKEGLLEPHIARVNALYRAKRDLAVRALSRHCAQWVRWDTPQGGFFLWLELAPQVDGRRMMRHAIAQGVVCRPGERFFGGGEEGSRYFRLAFIMVPDEEIERGIAVLAEAMRGSLREGEDGT